MGFSLNPLQDLGGVLHAGERLTDDGAKEFEGALKNAAKVVKNMSPSELGHTALDVIGMVPVVGTVANLANAGWYAAQGDWTNAAWSAAAAIPIEGEVADAAKLGKDAIEIAKDGAKAERIVKDGKEIEQVAKDGTKIEGAINDGTDVAKAGEKAGTVDAARVPRPPRLISMVRAHDSGSTAILIRSLPAEPTFPDWRGKH